MLLLAAGACGPAQTSSPAPEVEPVESPTNEMLKQHMFLGDQYINSKLPLKAAEEFQKALELDPENASVYERLGYAFLEAEDYDRAVRTYRRYVDLRPEDCKSHASLGFAYIRQGLTDQAIVAYEKALSLCPDDPNAYTNMGRAYLQGGYNLEAIEAFRRAIELNPSDILAYETLAKLYYDRKLYPEAISTYEAILARPDNGKDAGWVAWASRRLATMYKWAGACDQAIPYYQTAMAAEPDDEKLIRSLAVCFEETGQTDQAIRLYDALIAQVPDRPEYYYRLGELLNDMGRYQEAIRRVKEGKAYDTECGAHAYAVMGRAYEKMGGISNYKRAEREFERCANCGDPNLTDYCTKQIERQQQLVKIEELKKQKEQQGY